ncbi:MULTISPECIES: DUF309 domain-containing protein [Nonomuraea]|uniref:DUF309 domain-containing protein n=1 Tax=Nonomuraea harbinensis TaxID=1286938 RepID=A0ABW1C3T9_9ACTN|nr:MULTISPECIES: DUF309 domain-containing protein [Nonomuraea]TXK35299.1 DUF309 domain-containing protein [Nonomuraea sp. C10]
MRDRDPEGRPRNARPRDAFGRPLPYGSEGMPRVPDDYAPTTGQALADGRRFLEEGLPFSAHEVFEGRWKCAPEEERELWQGLAQICVGLTHLQRGNARGALTLFARGAARVQSYGDPYDAVGRAASGLHDDSDAAEAVALILAELPEPDDLT